jgi:acyl-CoA synthetase (AMP-forming)/AMP-acid ligase II
VAARTTLEVRLMVDGTAAGFESYDGATAGMEARPLEHETEGACMFYSSGTTGRPKGIERPLSGRPYGSSQPLDALISAGYGFGLDTVYLCPAPLYHAAPLGWSMATQRLGGTVILMERFDPLETLALIERHRVTHAQFVPTMFVRMLKLPADERRRFDLSSLRAVIHAAAPCPVDVKRQMIEWWGPLIYEYYAGSEGNGFCAIDSADWLAHPGSVGRPVGVEIHIVGEDGREVPTGAVGVVYFGGGEPFAYHNDAVKTAEAYTPEGWSTLGDVGYVDDEGYLYLTDRKSHMIISGGVNIYPQEVEDVLVLHPEVADVAVIGVPHAEMGEEVKAVVQLVDMSMAGPELERELIAYCESRVARFKFPRSVDFDPELPRLPTGKLAKRLLRDRYAGS